MTQRRRVQNERLMHITTNTYYADPIFRKDAHAREAIECLYRIQKLYPFLIYGFVIMPDHCHFLLYVLAPAKISQIMNSYKSGLTFDIGIPKIWQPRFHMTLPKDGRKVLKYIHDNPVEACLVKKPEDFPWSSASGNWDVAELGSEAIEEVRHRLDSGEWGDGIKRISFS